MNGDAEATERGRGKAASEGGLAIVLWAAGWAGVAFAGMISWSLADRGWSVGVWLPVQLCGGFAWAAAAAKASPRPTAGAGWGVVALSWAVGFLVGSFVLWSTTGFSWQARPEVLDLRTSYAPFQSGTIEAFRSQSISIGLKGLSAGLVVAGLVGGFLAGLVYTRAGVPLRLAASLVNGVAWSLACALGAYVAFIGFYLLASFGMPPGTPMTVGLLGLAAAASGGAVAAGFASPIQRWAHASGARPLIATAAGCALVLLGVATAVFFREPAGPPIGDDTAALRQGRGTVGSRQFDFVMRDNEIVARFDPPLANADVETLAASRAVVLAADHVDLAQARAERRTDGWWFGHPRAEYSVRFYPRVGSSVSITELRITRLPQ